MLSQVYKLMEKADKKREKANKINNSADSLEDNACVSFNKIISTEHIKQLCAVVDNKGFDGEKEDIHIILEKKQREDLSIDDLKKYKFLDEKYGENLEYNKSFLDRLFENLEE